MLGTVCFQRIIRASQEKVYRAFLEPEAMVKWLPPNGFVAKVHHIEAKVGGTYKMSFVNFGSGKSHTFGGTFEELKPFEKIRYTDRFDNPNLTGEIRTTITLREVFCGTNLEIVQEGLPAAIPPEACMMGWQESLSLLTLLVEADIPDGTED